MDQHPKLISARTIVDATGRTILVLCIVCTRNCVVYELSAKCSRFFVVLIAAMYVCKRVFHGIPNYQLIYDSYTATLVEQPSFESLDTSEDKMAELTKRANSYSKRDPTSCEIVLVPISLSTCDVH